MLMARVVRQRAHGGYKAPVVGFTSPHHAHYRTEVTQFWGDDNTNMTTAARKFLADEYDILMGGATGSLHLTPSMYTGENSAILSLVYIAHFNPDVSVVTGTIEPWLTANGYDVESAFEHHLAGDLRYDGTTGDGTITTANRVMSWFDSHGTVKHIINPDNAGIRAYWLNVIGSQDAALGFNGAFLDMYGDAAMVVKTKSGSDLYHIRGVEHPTFGPGAGSWGQAIIDHVTYLKANLPAGFIIQINTAEYKSAVSIGGDGVSWPTFNHLCAQAAGWEHRELDNAILDPSVTTRWDYWRAGVQTYGNVVQVTPNNESLFNGSGNTGATYSNGLYRDATLDTPALLAAGWLWGTTRRYIKASYRRAATEFCSFLMAITNDPDKWVFTPANFWATDPRTEWIGIMNYEPGAAVDANRVSYATGTWGTIWKREFENCWVFFRNQPSTNHIGSTADFWWDAGGTIAVTFDGTGDARNAPQTITFPGGATGYFVRHDGTIDQTPITSIGLRVCEGVIISKQATGGVVATSVAVTPTTASLAPGNTVQLSALASEVAGMPLRLLTTFNWASSNASAATVDSTGLVTSVANGLATITATEPLSGVAGTTAITVERQRTEWLRASDVTGKLDGQDVTNWPAANGTALTDVLGFPLQYVAVGRGNLPAIKGNGGTRTLQATVEMPATIDLWMVTQINGDGTSAFPRLFESGRYRCNLDNANRALQFLAFWSTGTVQFNTPNSSVPATGDLDVRIQYDSVGSPGTATIWLNGVSQSLSITDTHSGTLNATGTIYVANRSAVDRGLAGQFSEIEWYNVFLSTTEATNEASRLNGLYAGHF